MSDTENAAPAGDSGSSSMPEILSISAAASMMEQAEERHEEQDRQQDAQTDEADHNTSEQTEQDGDEGQDEQTAGEPEDIQAETDPSVDWEKVPGTAKFRLRDGKVVTGAELKERWDDLQQVSQARQAFDAERQQFMQWASQQAQTAQYLEQIAPQAIAAIQAQLPEIPPMPDASLLDTDPFGYQRQVDARARAIEDHNGKVAQMEEIQRAADMQSQQRQQESAQAQQSFLQDQRTKLFEAMPDLRDEAKRTEFASDLLKYGTQTYGFQPEEVNSAYDHRLMCVMRDAIAYQKLKANPPKPVQQQRPPGSVPVAQPGRRMPGPEARQARRQEIVQRANKSGGLSMREAASLMSAYEKD